MQKNIQCVTSESGHYFFGYYDKSPWNKTMKLMLACRADFENRLPTASDPLTIGLLNVDEGYKFESIATTTAWSWQQGCMLQWLDNETIIYNDCREKEYVSIIMNIHTGKTKILPFPIYNLDKNKKKALSLNFSRLQPIRPGYSYANIKDPNANIAAPENDGIYLCDIETGEEKLVISIKELASELDNDYALHWVDHLQFNTSGDKFIFLHRYTNDYKSWTSRLFTSTVDSERNLLVHDSLVSHFDWKDSENILCWTDKKPFGKGYWLINDKTNEACVIGQEKLPSDGHCSYSPDRNWILTDTYPNKNGDRKLIITDTKANKISTVGLFYSPFTKIVDLRCDLHPRWSPDGQIVCFDSIHEGRRKMYIADVSQIVKPSSFQKILISRD